MKVLIVDDEKLERVLISNAVEWEKYGFEVIGEAGNGEEALEFFHVNEPDLIVTDINMPFMDGISFVENVRKHSKTCHIIILTGYREFEYARKAVLLGVDDFIMKPINAAEVEKAIIASREKIELERGQKETIKYLQREAMDNRKLLRDAFLQRLLERRIDSEEAIHKLQMFQLTELMESCICINLRFSIGEEEEYKTIYAKKALAWIEGHTTAKVCFMHYRENIVLLFSKTEVQEIEEEMEQILQYVTSVSALEVEAAMSKKKQGISGIAEAYQQTLKVISIGFLLGRNRLLNYEEYERIRSYNRDDIPVNWKDFEMAMASEVYARVEGFVENYVRCIADGKDFDAGYLKIMALELLSRAVGVLTRYGNSFTAIMDESKYYKGLAAINHIEDMENFLKDTLQQILSQIQEKRTKKGTALIQNVQKYVRNHLANPELSLSLIATELYVNASYLSRAFKQEEGESLIEYITRNRIEKSMQLLDSTDLKAYEIADMVGIKDAHYFGICFKKYVGMTIKEYKGRGKKQM